MTSVFDSGAAMGAPSVPSGRAPFDALRTLCLADAAFAARYDGWEELGRGATATVVRTYLRAARVPVALKVWWRLSDADLRQLQSETQVLMRVLHPCVVRTFGVFDHGPLAWLEMELIDGPTLRDELRKQAAGGKRWPVVEALEIGACLAEGLAAVHAAGFVHRDVKPGNVLLPRCAQPAAKLADFGIARSLDATVILGDPVSGSPKYVCPEALLGQTPGTAGDVYGLAMTLYQVFSGGHYPFVLRERATVAEALDCHRRRAPIPLRVLGLGLPDEIVDVIQHGLDKNPRHRPTAAEVARVLRAAQRGESGAVPRVRRRAHGRVRRVLLALTGLSLTLALLVVWLLLRG